MSWTPSAARSAFTRPGLGCCRPGRVKAERGLPPARRRHRRAAEQRHPHPGSPRRLVVSVTRWIADHGGPALAPTSHPQPVWEADTVATLWPYLPSPTIPRARDLATVVRELHQLDAQPPPPPEHQPLARLHEALDLDTMRDQSVLPTDTRQWLLARAALLQHAYDMTVTPLGRGLVHADVQPDNLLQDHDGRWLLIDWDRELRPP